MNIIETIFQILFVVIMSIGILGLPLYFYLYARKKRIEKEFSEPKDKDVEND